MLLHVLHCPYCYGTDMALMKWTTSYAEQL